MNQEKKILMSKPECLRIKLMLIFKSIFCVFFPLKTWYKVTPRLLYARVLRWQAAKSILLSEPTEEKYVIIFVWSVSRWFPKVVLFSSIFCLFLLFVFPRSRIRLSHVTAD